MNYSINSFNADPEPCIPLPNAAVNESGLTTFQDQKVKRFTGKFFCNFLCLPLCGSAVYFVLTNGDFQQRE
jgi:hypothetical protein